MAAPVRKRQKRFTPQEKFEAQTAAGAKNTPKIAQKRTNRSSKSKKKNGSSKSKKQKRKDLGRISRLQTINVGRLKSLTKYCNSDDPKTGDTIFAQIRLLVKSFNIAKANCSRLASILFEFIASLLDPKSTISLENVKSRLKDEVTMQHSLADLKKFAEGVVQILDIKNDNDVKTIFRWILKFGFTERATRKTKEEADIKKLLDVVVNFSSYVPEKVKMPDRSANIMEEVAETVRTNICVQFEKLEELKSSCEGHFEDLSDAEKTAMGATKQFLVINGRISSGLRFKFSPAPNFGCRFIGFSEANLAKYLGMPIQDNTDDGWFIRNFLWNGEGKSNRKLRQNLASGAKVLHSHITTNGQNLKLLFFNTTKPKLHLGAEGSSVRAYDLEALIDGRANYQNVKGESVFTIQETSDLEKIEIIKKDEDANVSFIGIDLGVRFAAGVAALNENAKKLAYVNFKTRSYYGQTKEVFQRKLTELKNDRIFEIESGLNDRDDESDQLLRDFYSMPELTNSAFKADVLAHKWYQQTLSMVLQAAGANSHTKFDEYASAHQYFVFVFGLGDFESKGNKSIAKTLMNKWIRKVIFI